MSITQLVAEYEAISEKLRAAVREKFPLYSVARDERGVFHVIGEGSHWKPESVPALEGFHDFNVDVTDLTPCPDESEWPPHVKQSVAYYRGIEKRQAKMRAKERK